MAPINRQFDEDTARQHFIVRVQEIDVDGVWGATLATGTVSFFAMEHVMSIQEELELNPDIPEHAKLIEEYAAESEGIKQSVKTEKRDKPFVNIESLTKLTSQAKQTYESMQ